MSSSKTKRSPYQVQVLDRALAVLEVLGNQQDECSLPELSRILGLHKSTVHRLLMVLERHRFVDRNPDSGRYRLGFKLFELGSKVMANVDLRTISRPYLQRLLFETGETVHLCILDKGEALYVEKMEPERSVRLASSVGRRVPVHSTAVGKAMMAELPEADADDIIRRCGLKSMTRKTITTPAELKAELRAVHVRGYAIDDEENEEGVRCVGAAIRDYSDRPVGAISVSGPAFRVTKDRISIIARSVVEAVAALSSELGNKAQRPEAVNPKAI